MLKQLKWLLLCTLLLVSPADAQFIMPSGLGLDFVPAAGVTTYINSIQPITITVSSGSSSGTATITSVNVSNTVIVYNGFTSADTGNAYGKFEYGLTLTNATTVTATLANTTGGTLTVYATVVEFKASALNSAVQYGTVSTAGTSGTKTISSVTTANSVVFFEGWTTSSSTDNFIGRSAMACTLTNSTTVTCSKGTNSGFTTVAYFAVVEFKAALVNNMQQFNLSIASANATTSVTQTITSVNTSNAIIVYGGFEDGGVTIANDKDWQYNLQLTNATTVTATRSGTTSGDSRNIFFTVWELPSGILNSSVQRTTVALTSQTSNTATLSSVNTAKAFTTYNGFSLNEAATSAATHFASDKLTNATTETWQVNTSNTNTLTGAFEVIEFK